jgi:hypothetical protein
MNTIFSLQFLKKSTFFVVSFVFTVFVYLNVIETYTYFDIPALPSISHSQSSTIISEIVTNFEKSQPSDSPHFPPTQMNISSIESETSLSPFRTENSHTFLQRNGQGHVVDLKSGAYLIYTNSDWRGLDKYTQLNNGNSVIIKTQNETIPYIISSHFYYTNSSVFQNFDSKNQMILLVSDTSNTKPHIFILQRK